MAEKVTIRPALVSDAAALAALAGELGYPTTPLRMTERLGAASADPQSSVFVAEARAIVGWIHVAAAASLETDPHAEIRGLVVAGTHRGAGIGSRLVARAEEWAQDEGYSRIRVRTNVVRKEARAFYRRLGYALTKTQEVLDKPVPAPRASGDRPSARRRVPGGRRAG